MKGTQQARSFGRWVADPPAVGRRKKYRRGGSVRYPRPAQRVQTGEHPEWRHMPGDTRQQKRAAARDARKTWRNAEATRAALARQVLASLRAAGARC